MKRKIALQLYTLRDEIDKLGMPEILRQVAAMGYQEVEPAGFGKLTPREFATACADNGLKICSAHCIPSDPDDISKGVDMAGELGLKWVCIGYGPAQFKTLDNIKATAERSNLIIDKFAENGISVFQHNHYFEFALLNGRLKYDYYIDLCPRIKLELDVFWAANYGANDPVAMTKRFADRMVLIHVKDGIFPADPEEHILDLRPLGEGQLDIPAVMANTPDSISQIIIELDNSNIDMTESVRRSHDYLVRAGLGI